MAFMLQCDHVTKKVGNFLLWDIHFDLEPGYILGIIGSNGAGKSTLMRILLGSYKLYNHTEDCKCRTIEAEWMAANKGDVFLNGASIRRNPREYKNQTAFVMNDSPFALGMSARDNGLAYGRYYGDFDFIRYEKLCREYGVSYNTVLKKLSKGEQIKQQLAFAMSHSACLYILDEPAGNLDIQFREEFYEIMRDIVKDGDKSIIYVSHLVEEMDVLADYILWIEKGKQKSYGTLEELLDQYRLYSGPQGFLRSKEGYEVIGLQKKENHTEALVWSQNGCFSGQVKSRSRRAALKEIMYYEKESEEQVCRKQTVRPNLPVERRG
ncbi:MAG: ABC transporter ATP-binding protein [Lachnospiraceae bacterium]|nr:ABC transporter ATP-binding protein [Lachnospiraceae bacterium]